MCLRAAFGDALKITGPTYLIPVKTVGLCLFFQHDSFFGNGGATLASPLWVYCVGVHLKIAKRVGRAGSGQEQAVVCAWISLADLSIRS